MTQKSKSACCGAEALNTGIEDMIFGGYIYKCTDCGIICDITEPEEDTHNAIFLNNGLYAVAWDKRCDDCRNGRKHFTKEYTKKEIKSLKLTPEPQERKRHPDYSLKDAAAGRCPYCLSSADTDCDCEPAQNTPETVHKSDDMPKECADWKKEFDNKFHCGQVGCDCADGVGSLKNIKSFISSLLSAKDQEFRKTLNSGKKLYQLGRQEAIEECINKIPNEQPNQEVSEYYSGFNAAIQAIKSNLLKLK
jgi:hypothetical protein